MNEKLTPNCVVRAYAPKRDGGHVKKPCYNVILRGEYCHMWFGRKRDAQTWLQRQLNQTEEN